MQERSLKKVTRVLKAENLVKTYKKRRVVDGVSFSMTNRDIVGLLGPNGAGKTTTFYMVIGLVKHESGKVCLDNKDITDMPMHRRAKLGLGYLPQEPSIFRKLTVYQNLMAILETLSCTKHEREERAWELMDEFGILGLADSVAMALSGGERRRLEIARALCSRPSFIMLDEPFAGIDPIAVGDIQEMIRKLRDSGIGILITDHNVRYTLGITDRAYILNEGRIIEEGTPETIAASEQARKIYLGHDFSLK